jgi:hypothetical protein
MTNFEKIKAMSVEEMANIFYNTISCEDCPIINRCIKRNGGFEGNYKKCKETVVEYLESEVKEDG